MTGWEGFRMIITERSTGRRLHFFIPLLLFLLLIPSLCEATPRLGTFTFEYSPAKELVSPGPVESGIESMEFVSSVGGIAFGGIARSASGLEVAALAYNGRMPDGRRLTVTVSGPEGTRTLTAPIYDWQLIPITKFAARDEHSIFTLFGQLQDEKEAKERTERGERILNYHPAFVDTLLGLRLFQGDILILHEESCDLPREDDRYILGAGEKPPDFDENRNCLVSVHRFLDSLPGERFQSYIICDVGAEVTFDAEAGGLALSGDPIWRCWRRKVNDGQALDEVVKQANADAQEQFRSEYERDRQSLSAETFNLRYSPENQQKRYGVIFDKIISSRVLETMPDYSLGLSREIARLGGVNPAVYDALRTTMRYAAFLRHVRKENPSTFASLLSEVKDLHPEPQVRTPTVMIPAR